MEPNSDEFAGDLHGFLLYPSASIKDEQDAFTPQREITQREYNQAMTAPEDAWHPNPIQFELPRMLGGSIFGSSWDKPDPLRHHQAAAKLFQKKYQDFLNAAESFTRKHTGTPGGDGGHRHLQGIGSWENNVEPTLMTVFRRPITSLQLQRIGAELGSYARQHAILAFLPHDDGSEKLLHMRIKTHKPGQLSPRQIASISNLVSSEFNQYFDEINGQRNYLLPGRTILPDTTGHTDVLTWIPPWESNEARVLHAFETTAEKLGARHTVKFWPGTGTLLGGTSPFSDDEASKMSDDQKRDAAVANYHRQIAAVKPEIQQGPGLTAPTQFALNPEMWREGHLTPANDRAYWGPLGDHFQEEGYPMLGQVMSVAPMLDFDERMKMLGRFGSRGVGNAGHYGFLAGNPFRNDPNTPQLFANFHFHPQLGAVLSVMAGNSYPSAEHGTASFHIPDAHTALGVLEEIGRRGTELRQAAGLPFTHLTDGSYLTMHDAITHTIKSNPDNPQQLAMRSPAKTGIVVQGVFYRPGSLIPTIESPNKPKEEKESMVARARRILNKRVSKSTS